MCSIIFGSPDTDATICKCMMSPHSGHLQLVLHTNKHPIEEEIAGLRWLYHLTKEGPGQEWDLELGMRSRHLVLDSIGGIFLP
jgi:hypothetical protein